MGKSKIFLSDNNQKALQIIKVELNKVFKIIELIVFGSVARSEETEESELDLLIISEKPVSHREKHQMTD